MNSQGKEEQDKFREMLQLSQQLSQIDVKNEMFCKSYPSLNILSGNIMSSQGNINQSQENIDSQNLSVNAVFCQSQNIITQNEENDNKILVKEELEESKSEVDDRENFKQLRGTDQHNLLYCTN